MKSASIISARIKNDSQGQMAADALVAPLSEAAFTSLQFRSTNGGNRRTTRTARRSPPQQSAVRHLNSNPNLRRASSVVGGGTSGVVMMELDYPHFGGIAARRDSPLAMAGVASLKASF